MASQPLGVLVMAYGTPKNLDEVEAYYTHIRHGHAPTPELLTELKGRYEAIGGVSPLNEMTQAQGDGLQQILNQDGGRPCKVYLGMKHTHPFIAETVAAMADDHVEEAVSLVLAPHYSEMSVGSYQSAALDAAKQTGSPALLPVLSWHLHPGFLAVLSQRVQEALLKFENPNDVMVIFSAHSLPERILEQSDPYPTQLHETGDAIAQRLGLNRHMFSWQSAGRTKEKWLGPDILTTLKDLAAKGQKQVLVCPAGFVSDHLEVLYDLDIEAKRLADQLGITFERTRSLNADPLFLAALADVVRQRERLGTNRGEV
ncbi:ferrochelatase [Alicyclobacillus tolerans]|uniref:ferrochelatase n=1 Tax=Alicyclobacillus tolerans TaxID=90970 RepID=UPI001F020BB5|nr:ferrochelatase [Alicyclobacillus tolerans]MCF8565805.1 ferrochelatase [Alicyclobacillus tolerans]